MSLSTGQSLLHLRWRDRLTRGADHAPVISPLFVAEQGPSVQIADIRPAGQATGALGYIPGCVFAGVEELERLARGGALATPLVLVSATGEASARIALRLEELGASYVAAMTGGIVSWRALGLSTSRDASGVLDEFEPATSPDAGPGRISLEDVRRHIGDPRSVRWIKLTSLLTHGSLSCIDGRDERGVVGSPGGDGGEFLLALAAIERVAGRELDRETVARGLLSQLDAFGHFYMHTDTHALEALQTSLLADQQMKPLVAGFTQQVEWLQFLRRPDIGVRDSLLEHLLNPALIGCGHIRLMLQRSGEYGIRKELVLSFLRAAYRLSWEDAPEVRLTLLPGDHEEAAVVNVRLAEGVWGLSRVPLISPACGGRQMFVSHPGVSSFLRSRMVEFLVRGATALNVDRSQEAELREAVDEIAALQLGLTVATLAEGLPVFDVVFAADGSIEVSRVSP